MNWRGTSVADGTGWRGYHCVTQAGQAYANNDPVRYSDPSGHWFCEDVDADGNCKRWDGYDTHNLDTGKVTLSMIFEDAKETRIIGKLIPGIGVTVNYSEIFIILDNAKVPSPFYTPNIPEVKVFPVPW